MNGKLDSNEIGAAKLSEEDRIINELLIENDVIVTGESSYFLFLISIGHSIANAASFNPT